MVCLLERQETVKNWQAVYNLTERRGSLESHAKYTEADRISFALRKTDFMHTM